MMSFVSYGYSELTQGKLIHLKQLEAARLRDAGFENVRRRRNVWIFGGSEILTSSTSSGYRFATSSISSIFRPSQDLCITGKRPCRWQVGWWKGSWSRNIPRPKAARINAAVIRLLERRGPCHILPVKNLLRYVLGIWYHGLAHELSMWASRVRTNRAEGAMYGGHSCYWVVGWFKPQPSAVWDGHEWIFQGKVGNSREGISVISDLCSFTLWIYVFGWWMLIRADNWCCVQSDLEHLVIWFIWKEPGWVIIVDSLLYNLSIFIFIYLYSLP